RCSAVRGRTDRRAHSPGSSLLRSLDLAKLRRRHEPVLARRRHTLGRRALRGHRGEAVFAFVEAVVGWAKGSAPTRLSRIGTKLRVGGAHTVKFALRGKPLGACAFAHPTNRHDHIL